MKYDQEYDLTHYQQISLIMIRFLKSPDLVKILIGHLRQKEFFSAQQEHLDMRSRILYLNAGIPYSVPVPITPQLWRLTKGLHLDINCMIDGFLYMMKYREEMMNDNLVYLPGAWLTIKIEVNDKIKILNRLYHLKNEEDTGIKELDIRISIDGYLNSLKGLTGQLDYGGIYLENMGETKTEDMNIMIL
jgi:hypothetical protein